jgi:hypothetical protein
VNFFAAHKDFPSEESLPRPFWNLKSEIWLAAEGRAAAPVPIPSDS